MKQKTMDHELMARLNREAQEDESKRFEEAKAKVARLENKRKVGVGVRGAFNAPGRVARRMPKSGRAAIFRLTCQQPGGCSINS